jgi:tetratricopeptide (TPR) repeat protein
MAAAEQYWDQAIVRYPHFARTARASLDVLLALKRFDEAEALVLEGRKREPVEPFYAGGYARVAESRGDLDEAITRWSTARKQFPAYPDAYVGGGSCLRRVGRLDEAEALIKKAIEIFPREVPPWIEWGRAAEARADWQQAIQRWESFYQKFRNSHGDIGVAHGLMKLGRLDEAEERLRAAQLRFPIMPEISIALAQVAEQRGDKDEAVRRWADTLRRFPLMHVGYQSSIRVLREMGRIADADTVAVAAIDRFPTDAWPAVEAATLATERGDWEAAVQRWEAVRKGWPDRQDGYSRGAEALTALGRLDEAAELKARIPH